MQSPRVTLRDIAERLGVTKATVSLALRNSREVSAERRAQIQKVAKEMGYKPDPALTALAEYRRDCRRPGYREQLAFLYQTRDPSIETFELWGCYPIRQELLAGIRQRAEDLGYGLEIHEMGTDPIRQKRVARILASRGIRGILVHANLQPPEEVFRQFSDFAGLNVLQFAENPSFNSIRSNDYEAMRMALMRLYDLGYRRPLYVRSEPLTGLFGPEKMGGFDWFMSEYKDTECRWIYGNDFRSNLGNLVRGVSAVDVILTHIHEELEAAAKEQGIDLRRSCGICSLFATKSKPEYGGTDIQAYLLGKKAVEMTDMMLRHNEIGVLSEPATLLIPNKWQDGPSVPQRASRAKKKKMKAF